MFYLSFPYNYHCPKGLDVISGAFEQWEGNAEPDLFVIRLITPFQRMLQTICQWEICIYSIASQYLAPA